MAVPFSGRKEFVSAPAEVDENLYIVSRRHVESNEVIFDTPVRVCTECGIVYVWKPYRLAQCPLRHDQKRPNPEGE